MSFQFSDFSSVSNLIDQSGFDAIYAAYTVSQPARDPSVIRQQSKEKVVAAFNSALFHIKESNAMVLPKSEGVKDMDMKDESLKLLVESAKKMIPQAMLNFAMREGSLNDTRYYVRVASLKDSKEVIFASFPGLMTDKGSLQIAFAAEIHQQLLNGKDTAVSAFFKEAAKFEPKQKGHLFTKAMHAPGFPSDKETRDLWKKDMDLIMSGMKLRPKKTVNWTWGSASELKYFKKDSVPAAQSVPAPKPSVGLSI